MKSVRIHGVLLAMAVVAAFLTWTREQPTTEQLERPLVWERDTADVMSVIYEAEDRRLDITRRTEDGDTYLWGVEVTPSRGPVVEGADTAAFPVGQPGSAILNGFAAFRVLRELGRLSPEHVADFGLDEPSGRVTVGFPDGSRVIEVGDAVHGGADYFGRDTDTGDAMVLPGDLIGPLRTGSGAVRERRLHYFAASEVGQVRVDALGRERSMNRREGGPRAPAVWSPTGEVADADQTFANFMERVGQLAIEGFGEPIAADDLERLMRLDYSAEDGEPLGWVELYRGPRAGTYYLRSERTRVAATAIAMLAERVEQGLADLF